jgi:hypothetical protein
MQSKRFLKTPNKVDNLNFVFNFIQQPVWGILLIKNNRGAIAIKNN